IHSYGMRAAGIASRRPIDGRVIGPARISIRRRNEYDFPFAEHPIAPGAHELSPTLKFQNRMCAPMKHQDVPTWVDGDGRRLNQIPWACREAGSAGGLGWPIHQLITQLRNVKPRPWSVRSLAKSGAEKAKPEQAHAAEAMPVIFVDL